MDTSVLVGEAEAGRATQVRRAINKLISTSTSSTFDLAELLFEAKQKNFYAGWGFESFSRFAKSLEIKYTKSYYLVRIVENSLAAGLTRDQYEPVGLGKLRIISRLQPESTYNETPVNLLIRELTLKAKEMSLEEVQIEVDTILGLTADESLVWLNIRCKKLARENVIKPALELVKRYLGQTQNDEGEYEDASDGRALEAMAADILSDPNWNVEDVAAPKPEVTNGTPEATDGSEEASADASAAATQDAIDDAKPIDEF